MKRNILIADSGSTKTEWALVDGKSVVGRLLTQGINPYVLSDNQVQRVLCDELCSQLPVDCVEEVRFYGAGCRGDQLLRMTRLIAGVMPSGCEVKVASDLLGAAQALCGKADGIACILGTGSNSCLYQNGEIVQNVSPLGYVLGDEGSGAVLGRRLVGDVLKSQLSASVCDAFRSQMGLSADEIIHRVYKEPMANRFLASFAPFLSQYQAEESVHQLLVDEFSRFVVRNLLSYGHKDLPVHFVGSIAVHFRSVLVEVLHSYGLCVGKVLRAPMDGLLDQIIIQNPMMR